jgi:CheY-like chemotaxis protein
MLSSDAVAQPTTNEPATVDDLERAVRMVTHGDRAGAAELLRVIVSREVDNAPAWVWLASVADDPDESLDALRTAHRLAPAHERTASSLRKRLFREGVAAAQRGNGDRARTLLRECADLDPHDSRVWLWLASAAADRQDAMACLRRTLEIDPEHQLARATLRKLMLNHDDGADRKADLRTEPARLFGGSGRWIRATGRAIRPWAWGTTDPAQVESEALAEAHAEMAAGGTRASPRVQPRASVRTEILPGFDPLSHRIFAFGESSLTADGRLVMVVDESPAVHAKVAQALERYGHKVLPALDANDALEKLAEVEPDLILVDVAAAEEAGYRLLRTLRERIGSPAVPVVLAGAGGVVSRARGWLAGASDSIAKPFPEGALLSLVDRYAATN